MRRMGKCFHPPKVHAIFFQSVFLVHPIFTLLNFQGLLWCHWNWPWNWWSWTPMIWHLWLGWADLRHKLNARAIWEAGKEFQRHWSSNLQHAVMWQRSPVKLPAGWNTEGFQRYWFSRKFFIFFISSWVKLHYDLVFCPQETSSLYM